jgi:hypothetical protein
MELETIEKYLNLINDMNPKPKYVFLKGHFIHYNFGNNKIEL